MRAVGEALEFSGDRGAILLDGASRLELELNAIMSVVEAKGRPPFDLAAQLRAECAADARLDSDTPAESHVCPNTSGTGLVASRMECQLSARRVEGELCDRPTTHCDGGKAVGIFANGLTQGFVGSSFERVDLEGNAHMTPSCLVRRGGVDAPKPGSIVALELLTLMAAADSPRDQPASQKHERDRDAKTRQHESRALSEDSGDPSIDTRTGCACG